MNNETMEYFKLWKNDIQEKKFPVWLKEEDKQDYIEFMRENYRKNNKIYPLVKELKPLTNYTITWFDELLKRPDFPQLISGLIKEHDIWGEYVAMHNFALNNIEIYNHHTIGNVLKVDFTFFDKDKNSAKHNKKYFTETSSLVLAGSAINGPESELFDSFNVNEIGRLHSTSTDFAEILMRTNGNKIIDGKTYTEVISDRCKKAYKYEYFIERERIQSLIDNCESSFKAKETTLPQVLDNNKIDFNRIYDKKENFKGLFKTSIM